MDKLPEPPKVIIRQVRAPQHEHEGGAWKIAMADFALAMMALFIVLWIVNSSNAEQRAQISEYFQNPPAFNEANKDGARLPSSSPIDLGGSPAIVNQQAASLEKLLDSMRASDIQSLSEAIDAYQNNKARESLEAELAANPVFRPFQNQMLVDITDEGVRLQIVEQSERAMFEEGDAELKYYAEDILWALAPVLMQQSQAISISGYSEGEQDREAMSQSSWLLSSMRADAARRALMEAGVPKGMLHGLVGKSDTDPLYDNQDDVKGALNRRIAITLLTHQPRRDRLIKEEKVINETLTPLDDAPKQTQERLKDVLQSLKNEREKEGNSYDNPPNQDEAFW